MVYAVSNISSIFRWLINGFSERSPVNPQSSQRPIHGSRHTKVRPGESGPDAEVREAQAAHFQIRSAVRKCNSGLGDLVVKYQRIMVKHMVINLTGTILQFESGFFICLGCAGLRIQKKVGKAVLSVKGQAVIASLGVWQNRDIKRRMSADGEIHVPFAVVCHLPADGKSAAFRMWRMRSTKSKG